MRYYLTFTVLSVVIVISIHRLLDLDEISLQMSYVFNACTENFEFGYGIGLRYKLVGVRRVFKLWKNAKS